METFFKIFYKCEYCGSVYNSPEEAEKCETDYRETEKLKNLCVEPYHWYFLTDRTGKSKMRIFADKVECVNGYSRCNRNNVKITNFFEDYYYLIPENWLIDKVLSIEDMYDEFGIVPPITPSSSRRSVPSEYAVRIKRIWGKYKDDFTKQYSELSKEKLVDALFKSLNGDIIYNGNKFLKW